MLIVFCVATALVAFVIVSRVRMQRGVRGTDLGSMGANWLARHRASHPL